MPVVPFSPTPPREERQTEFTSAQEPWALMAAAQMDAEGRLVKSESATADNATPEDNANG